MRIGILTGGGDVPGLNPCMKAVVNRGTEEGLEVIGFRRGWAGPLNYNPALSLEENKEWAVRMTPDTVRPIDRTGGTFLHTSRTNPGKTRPQDLPELLADEYPIEDGVETVDCTPHWAIRSLDPGGCMSGQSSQSDDHGERHNIGGASDSRYSRRQAVARIPTHILPGKEQPSAAALGFHVTKAAMEAAHETTLLPAGDIGNLTCEGSRDHLLGFETENLRGAQSSVPIRAK